MRWFNGIYWWFDLVNFNDITKCVLATIENCSLMHCRWVYGESKYTETIISGEIHPGIYLWDVSYKPSSDLVTELNQFTGIELSTEIYART